MHDMLNLLTSMLAIAFDPLLPVGDCMTVKV